MITHVVVELEHPIEEGWMRDYSDEYYGIGRPLTMCKDCKWWNADTCMEWYDTPYTPSDGFCHKGERK